MRHFGNPTNYDKKALDFEHARRTYHMEKFYDGPTLRKVIVTADERLGLHNGLKEKVRKILQEAHPNYLGVSITYLV